MGVQLLTPEILNSALERWYASGNWQSVAFRVDSRPVVEPIEDYRVVYEAVFESPNVSHARVELWLTDVGDVGVGVEKRDRIARRLHERNFLSGFAAGHEPVRVGLTGLMRFLEFAAAGQIVITARKGMFWLGKTNAALPSTLILELMAAGYDYLDWIKDLTIFSPVIPARILKFEPWT